MTDVFRDVISLIINQGDRREPLADTKCPPAAQHKRASLACIYIYIYIRIAILFLKIEIGSTILFKSRIGIGIETFTEFDPILFLFNPQVGGESVEIYVD